MTVGPGVGTCDGIADGFHEGPGVGRNDGLNVGAAIEDGVGPEVGLGVGALNTAIVCLAVGEEVLGTAEGAFVGTVVGMSVASYTTELSDGFSIELPPPQ